MAATTSTNSAAAARRWAPSRSTSNLLAAAVLASSLGTLLIVLVPSLRFAYRQPSVDVALETCAALIGLLVTYLVFGRYRRQRRLDDLVLCYALATLTLTNVFFAALPAIAGQDSTGFSTWAAATGRLLGAAAFAWAAFAPRRVVQLTRSQGAWLALSLPLLMFGIAVGVALGESHLPRDVVTLFPPEASGRPQFVDETSVLVVQLTTMVLYVTAAAGFARRAAGERDELTRWLAVAAAFGAFTRLNYILYPSLHTEWVYTGDFFRLAFYVAILGAALREIGSYWERMSHAAALEERRRIARDLHDGLAQELAFIARNLQRLDRSDPNVARIAASASRALDESRLAIAALTHPLDTPFDQALADAARETAEREGVSLFLSLARDVEVDQARREALIRIACEAIANAARHSGTEDVTLELEKGPHVTLRVIDRGSGFDPESLARTDPAGFGVLSMRERAARVGAQLRLASGSQGTTVEIVV